MFGVNQKLLDFIEKMIGTQFDEFLINFLGIVPKIDKTKKFTLVGKKDSLTHLFVTALGSKPNKAEEAVLKTNLRVAAGYVEALKVRTQTRAIQAVNAHGQEQALKKESIRPSVIRKLVVKELEGSQNHVKMIAASESNKCANTATALQIIKVAASNDDNDPTVFFNIVDDDVTGAYEYILHLLPDRKTPRVWRLSEISGSYYKNGEQYPSVCGLHVNCRCKITYLPPFFGYNEDGKITWRGLKHDEFKEQRDKYGLPDVPDKISRKKVDKK